MAKLMTRRGVLGLLTVLAAGGAVWGGKIYRLRQQPPLPVQTKILSGSVQVSSFRLGNLTLGASGRVFGSKGWELFQIVDDGQNTALLYRFENRIAAIHERADGLMIVATDDGRWDPEKLCRVYRSRDGGQTFTQIKSIEGGTLLWWSLDSDRDGRLYMAEYGPQKRHMSKTLWRSVDDGDRWQVIYEAPDKEKIHLHRIAVDPYTDELWLTAGDGKYRDTLRSVDHGDTWTEVKRLQSTAVAFSQDAIYWGRDEKGNPGVLRYDRNSGEFSDYFAPDKLGNYGGSVYDMVILPGGDLIVPFMKYPDQDHVSSVWRVSKDKAVPILQLASEQGKGVAIETIAGPDKDGWVYWTGFQLKVD